MTKIKRKFQSTAATACVAALALILLTTAAAQAGHVKVFLLGGQSNMDGRGATSGLPTSPMNLQQPQADVLLYEGGSLGDLQPGGSQFGPEITFGRTITDALPAENFALIKYAVGGTDLYGDWNPAGGTNYTAFNNTVTNGLTALTNAGHTYEIVGMLWTQGENDARDGQGAAYEANLNNFIASMRASYGTDLPFFFSRLSSGQTDLPLPELALVRTAQDNVGAADANAYQIDTESFSLANDDLHFDAAGQIALGEAFGQAYLSTVPEPSSLVLLGGASALLIRRQRRYD